MPELASAPVGDAIIAGGFLAIYAIGIALIAGLVELGVKVRERIRYERALRRHARRLRR